MAGGGKILLGIGVLGYIHAGSMLVQGHLWKMMPDKWLFIKGSFYLRYTTYPGDIFQVQIPGDVLMERFSQ
jgi:hypothetical protein